MGSFPGKYAWLSRLDNLGKSVSDFSPNEMKYLNFYQSSELSNSVSMDLDDGLRFHSVPHATRKAWYEETPSAVPGVGQTSFSTQFVTGVKKRGTVSLSNKTNCQEASKQYYDNHCFLPAASQEYRLIKVDFVSGLLIAYYGQKDDTIPENQMCAVGMAIYCVDSRSYSYTR